MNIMAVFLVEWLGVKFKMVIDELLNLAPNVQLRKVFELAVVAIDWLSVQLIYNKLLPLLAESILIKNIVYIIG